MKKTYRQNKIVKGIESKLGYKFTSVERKALISMLPTEDVLEALDKLKVLIDKEGIDKVREMITKVK